MVDINTAKVVRMAMAKKGIKGKDLAELMGVVPLTVTRWRDKGCNNLRLLEKIAGHCGMTYNDMMGLAE